MSPAPSRFVSRAGEKLDAALDAFDLDVSGRCCADFGCNVGGFTDCLLRRGARKVYALDTGYGQLAWTLRRDERIVAMERTNALYCPVPELVGCVVCDVGWTCQRRVVPAAMNWLAADGLAVSLLKPHYELTKLRGRKPRSALTDAESEDVCRRVCEELAALCRVRAVCRSPLRGKGGNVEYLLWLEPAGGQTG